MLSNPPYGVDWKKYEGEINTKAKKGDKGRYGAGLPRTTDGSLLFLMHMISKMKKTESGTRLAIVFNGSPLFTGEAGQRNENGIRKSIIENDWLEAIVGLPKDLFFNTGIQTYIWSLSNRKPEHRKDRIQLLNAESFYDKMKKNVGEKRNEITIQQIEEQQFESNTKYKITSSTLVMA
jgi:type I restriction enzyme M protein